jgi:hypothetical protein
MPTAFRFSWMTAATSANSAAPRCLVLTTNYDLAIEHSARLVGREVVSLTLDDLPTALRSEREILRVVHLHGVVTNPSTIVLSPESYSAALGDERMQLVTRALGSEFRLLFLGHSLSPTEQHLRRDLAWAARIRSVSGIDRQHLLLAHVSENGDAAVPGQAQLLRDAGVQAVFIQDLDLRFRSVDIVANILTGSSRAIRRFPAATIRDARDPNYLPSIFNAISACDAPSEWKEDLLQKLAGNCDKEALRNMLREADGQWILPALVKLGDCEAEAKLLTLNTATTESLLAVVGHRSYRPWVQDLSCPSSAPVLFEVIRRSLVEGAEIHELETAMRALDRCAGAEVESYYDLLISDEKIPGAAFLFYQKRVALDTLTEKMAQELTVDGQELSASVAALVH